LPQFHARKTFHAIIPGIFFPWTADVSPWPLGFVKRKAQYDESTNGTRFRKNAHLPLGESASAQIEARQLVV